MTFPGGIDPNALITATALLIVPGILAWLRERDKRLIIQNDLAKLREDFTREINEVKARALDDRLVLQRHDADFKAGTGRFEEISNKLAVMGTKLDFVMEAVKHHPVPEVLP